MDDSGHPRGTGPNLVLLCLSYPPLNLTGDVQGSRQGEASLVSVPASKRKAESETFLQQIAARPNDAAANLAEAQRLFRYVELQYQGGVKAKDIREVGFHEAPTEEIKAALAARKIPWRILPP